MVNFEPFLIAAPDFLRCCLGRKTECLKGLGFEHFEFSFLEIGLLRLALCCSFSGIQCLRGARTDFRRDWDFGRLADSRSPSRTTAGSRFLLIASDVRVRCSRRVTVSLVVFFDVIKTEQQVKAFSARPHRGTMRANLFTTVPLAFRASGFAGGFASRSKAHEYFRIKRHRICMDAARPLGKI